MGKKEGVVQVLVMKMVVIMKVNGDREMMIMMIEMMMPVLNKMMMVMVVVIKR